MDDGLTNVAAEDQVINKMGATSNSNVARLTTLQERKKQIEEALAKCNQELRQLCIQEAELTGITPPEMPLEPGETLPLIRRRVGTAYQLNEALFRSGSKDESVADIELQIQLHNKLAEAALGLSGEHNTSKTVKRQHRAEYQKHKAQVQALTEKLNQLKEKSAVEQLMKQKKKPRVPDPQDDSISVNTNINEQLLKADMRHSLHFSKHSLSSNEGCVETRYISGAPPRYAYRNSEHYFSGPRPEDALAKGVYRLSLSGYDKYMERREHLNSGCNTSSYNVQGLSYNLPYSTHMQQYTHNQHIAHYQQYNPNSSQHSSHISQHNTQVPPHSLQISPHGSQISQHSPRIMQQSPHMSQHSPRLSQHSPHFSQSSPQMSHSPLSQQSPLHQRSVHSIYNFPQCYNQETGKHRESSSPTAHKYYSHTIHGDPSYKQSYLEGSYRNPHQLQPHQQYEHNGMSTGLGGCWKRSETGEMFWYNASNTDNNWQRDKRFGSLDRRKNKRVNKRVSPVDSKSATLSGTLNYPEQVRTASIKSSQVQKVLNRRCQDNRQLVRTQSLGSVGAQNIDSVFHSDDNSSEADNKSISESREPRKHKEKEWTETSLDDPISPTQLTSRFQSAIPSVLAPEEKYTLHSPPPIIQNPIPQKPVLEIPAETNPSPHVEPNIELFNNNIPKHCTIVQAGQCKPYHEETKPFEMSDFYKYSTKFKKSPTKQPEDNKQNHLHGSNVQKALGENFEEHGTRSPFHPTRFSGGTMGSPQNLNTSLDFSRIQVSEHFSAEMNAWYNDHENQIDNNNGGASAESRSAATLV